MNRSRRTAHRQSQLILIVDDNLSDCAVAANPPRGVRAGNLPRHRADRDEFLSKVMAAIPAISRARDDSPGVPARSNRDLRAFVHKRLAEGAGAFLQKHMTTRGPTRLLEGFGLCGRPREERT